MAVFQKSKTMVFPKVGKISMVVFAVLLIGVVIWAFQTFGYIFNPNVVKDTVITIPTGASYGDVEKMLKEQQVLENYKAFRWVAKKKNYKSSVKPGRYELKKGWNINQVVNKLRSGVQDPLDVTFNNVRTFPELAGKVAAYLETDSISLLAEFMSDAVAQKYGFTKETFPAMFIPNTYELYWTTTPSQFIERMKKEYDRFWSAERKNKANTLGINPLEVSILASIVQEETNLNTDKPIIAGVYVNRLKRGMPLQACPTVKFALGDFSIRRVTTEMTQTDSPYNTYRIAGLPPGLITFPDLSSINAVLNAQNHDYYYFSAKEDFSGHTTFARTLTEHNRNASRYQQALNEKKIWR